MEVRNRFKGPDLIDGVPDELWNEVHDIVQETGIKTIPMEKKCRKAQWLSGEALQIAVKRREAKSKGAKQRYKHLNAELGMDREAWRAVTHGVPKSRTRLSDRTELAGTLPPSALVPLLLPFSQTWGLGMRLVSLLAGL